MEISEIVERHSFAEYMEMWLNENPRPNLVDCDCSVFVIMQDFDRIGRVRYEKRCTKCFAQIGNQLKIADALEMLAGEKPYDAAPIRAKKELLEDKMYPIFTIQCEEWRTSKKAQFWHYHGAYMKSLRWKLLRVKVLTRDGYQCRICGNKNHPDSPLQLHHLNYDNFGVEELDDLLTLCKDCHLAVHEADRN